MYAVFPLNIVVLPEESVALHLFEPRYRQLYQDYKNGKSFVILYTAKNQMVKIGSLVYIEDIIKEFPDGTVDVVVKGIRPISIQEFVSLYPGKMYSGIEGEELDIFIEPKKELIEESVQYFNSIRKKQDSEENISTYAIAQRLCLDEDKKQKVIEAKSEKEINTLLLNEIRLLSKVFREEINLSERFFLN